LIQETANAARFSTGEENVSNASGEIRSGISGHVARLRDPSHPLEGSTRFLIGKGGSNELEWHRRKVDGHLVEG
jgi:hypothetical protein